MNAFICITICLLYAGVHLHVCSGVQDPPRTICSEQRSPCECVFSDGSEIDLTSIANKDSNEPRFFRVPGLDNFYYYYNPCFPFSIGDACGGVAACQEWYSQFNAIGFAQSNQVSFGEDDRGTFIYYQGAKDNFAIHGRVTIVYLQCNENPQAPPRLTVEGDTAEEHRYIMTLDHHSACLKAGSGSKSGSSGLSIGTYMCIGFAVVLILYFSIGVAFMRIRRGAEGKEMIPNYAIWVALPGLIKDGFNFIREKITGFSTRSRVKYEEM